jgi:hypothetical protein
MPSADRKLELKAKTSVAQTASQAAVYAKGLKYFCVFFLNCNHHMHRDFLISPYILQTTQNGSVAHPTF